MGSYNIIAVSENGANSRLHRNIFKKKTLYILLFIIITTTIITMYYHYYIYSYLYRMEWGTMHFIANPFFAMGQNAGTAVPVLSHETWPLSPNAPNLRKPH